MEKNKDTKKILTSASLFLLLMGIVSLLSDMTHEGASGITGGYLSFLGASSAVIGFVSGLGTFIGYGLRILTGYIADKKKNYWTMTIIGYAIDLLFIPLLALVPQNGWVLACGFLVAGKIGNAIKKPAKDTMVSFAGSNNGQGKNFAILEFVDQIGAVLGPTLLFFIMLITKGKNLSQYQTYVVCFSALLLPALACVGLLFFAKHKFPHPENYEKESIKSSNKFNKTYILYIVAICLYAFGFINYPLIETHIANLNVISTTYIPLLYSLAMLIDAFSALIFGTLYDKYGFVTLVISTLLSTTFSLFVFTSSNVALIIVGIILWGIGMGAQESIMKAGIASLTSKENRSKGYGIFQIFFGASMLVGGSLAGVLHDNSITLMIIVSILFQFLSAVIFIVTDLSNKKRIKSLESLSLDTNSVQQIDNTENSITDITQEPNNVENSKNNIEN